MSSHVLSKLIHVCDWIGHQPLMFSNSGIHSHLCINNNIYILFCYLHSGAYSPIGCGLYTLRQWLIQGVSLIFRTLLFIYKTSTCANSIKWPRCANMSDVNFINVYRQFKLILIQHLIDHLCQICSDMSYINYSIQISNGKSFIL